MSYGETRQWGRNGKPLSEVGDKPMRNAIDRAKAAYNRHCHKLGAIPAEIGYESYQRGRNIVLMN